MMPSVGRQTWVPQRPWIIIAASTSLKTPASISLTLPAPPSSAGVPITWTRPGNGSVPSATARATPAPVPAVAMTLWPQAWPMPGSASYSAMIAIVGPGPAPSIVARNAVESPPTARSTRAPCLARNSVSHACACSSLNASSGWSWIRWERASSSSARRSTAAAVLGLSASTGPVTIPGAARLDDAARPEVGAEGLEQRRIALHRLVDVVRALDDPERSARGLRRRLRARDDALLERPHVVEIDRAYVEDGGGELGDDVGRRAAVGDDAMDARVGAYLLAQHRHVGVGLDGGVERVHALPRVRGGVRRLARELQADARDP